MDKKKIFLDAFIILLTFIIFVTWHGRKFETIPAGALRKPVVYLITVDKVTRFWYQLDSGADDMAKQLGITYIWEAPEIKSADAQIELINEVVEAGADAIMLAAIDPVRISGAVEDAKVRGVKIIYVDAPAVEEAEVTLATDNYLAGKLAAQVMLSELGELGTAAGSIGIIGATAEIFTNKERERGFRDAIGEDGRFNIPDTKYTGGDPDTGQAAAAAFITEYDNLVGMFAVNEGSTIGMARAIEAYNRRIIGIGFDITDETLEMLRRDILKAVMVQNPYTMGYLGMAEAIAAIRGLDTGPDFINTGISVLTRYSPVN